MSKLTAFAVCLLLGTRLGLAQPAEIAFFEQKIRPVLVEHCYACHSGQAAKLKGNLRLDSRAGWQAGGDSGQPAIVPGRPADSPLIRAIRHQDVGTEMPPDKSPLPDAVIADFVTWVKNGAADPREGGQSAPRRGGKSWWSLQPLRTQFAHAKIDDFVAAKLAEQHLYQNPPADPRALIRRMTYDVIGLPPTPEEVSAFVTAYSSDPHQAVETLVDRLLALPGYGEHWGRHWLDVVRFGESNGFERNSIIDDLWPFRDYVIRSLNVDKPFQQFLIEHLAGDIVGRDDPEVEVGTAFLVAGPYDDVGNQDLAAQANIRAATLDDIITATSGAFLGLTINCARCHDHKFDPVPQEDYYRLRAAFEGVTHGRRVLATPQQKESFAAARRPLNEQKTQLAAELAALNKSIDERAQRQFALDKPTRPPIDVHGTTEVFPPESVRYVKFVIHALTSDPAPRKAPGPRGGRLSEFEIWSAGAKPRNVALATAGARAEGARSQVAEDFPAAYGPELCIDGEHGEQWFIGQPAELTVTLAREEIIDRITFTNSKGRGVDESRVRGATPCEYEVQVSTDGRTWRTVASNEGRQPWSPDHGVARARRDVITAAEQQRLVDLERQIARIDAQLRRVPALQQVWAGNFAQPAEPTVVHLGGDPQKPGATVAPASLRVLESIANSYELAAEAPESERRLALARWIASDDNPLTLRVLANRVWQYHFGQGLVDTPSDFGFLGGRPSHPELLDFLAQRLLAHGWRLKPLHREILLSQTYQQSSSFHEGAARLDQDARLLWRFPPRRLAAEELRDTLLQVAGVLRHEPRGGPGFRLYHWMQNNVSTYSPLDRHGPETYRRAVYHQNARASVVDLLTEFDLPDIAFAAPQRAATTTPLQALTLLNHRFTHDMARAFAGRLPTDDPVQAAYSLAFQRAPTPAERNAAAELLESQGLVAFCRALLNANELIFLD